MASSILRNLRECTLTNLQILFKDGIIVIMVGKNLCVFILAVSSPEHIIQKKIYDLIFKSPLSPFLAIAKKSPWMIHSSPSSVPPLMSMPVDLTHSTFFMLQAAAIVGASLLNSPRRLCFYTGNSERKWQHWIVSIIIFLDPSIFDVLIEWVIACS